MARRAPLFLLLSAACALQAQDTPRLPAARSVADFADEAEGRRWRTVLDGVMGGRSTGSFVVEDDRMLFTGVLNTNGGGFSSVRRRDKGLQLGQQGELGIRLRVRGDGRRYTLRLRQPNGRRLTPSYRAQFLAEDGDGWQDVYVPYASLKPTWRGRKLDLPPLDPTKVDEVGISIDDKIDGPFRLEVREVATYGSFSFDDFRRGKRPLVVFSDDPADPRLATQRAAADAARAGFDEREMELVVVARGGASSAGAQSLDEAACAALRERFATQLRRTGGGFVALLVGKDGGVKRVSAEPVSAAALFAQVDMMPMRIREARRRSR